MKITKIVAIFSTVLLLALSLTLVSHELPQAEAASFGGFLAGIDTESTENRGEFPELTPSPSLPQTFPRMYPTD